MEKKTLIDRRPLPILFLIEYKNAIFLSVIFSIFIVLVNSNNLIPDISIQGYRTIIIFFLAIVLWSTNLIPLSITSLLIMGLLSGYQVVDRKTVYSFFGNSSIFFILGSFIISAGVRLSGLSKRISYLVISRFGTSPFGLILSIFLLGFSLSHIMPEHGVAALLFPIVGEIITIIDLKNNKKFNTILYLFMLWGCVIGGVVTFLGGARNPLAIGILKDLTGVNVSFFRWIILVAPQIYIFTILLLIGAYFYIKKRPSIKFNKKEIEKNFKRINKISFIEIKAGLILVFTIYLWLFYNEKIGIANIALISASLYFVLNVISWKETTKEINWGVIFMYGGAIAMGSALDKAGVLEWFVKSFISDLNINSIMFLVLTSLICLVLTELVSNTAVVVVILPIAIKIALNLGIDTVIVTVLVAIPAGLAFLFPIASPPIALIYESENVSKRMIFKNGVLIKMVAWSIFIITSIIIWKINNLI